MEDCVDKYGEYLPNFDIPLPTKEDFDKMAGDDGCLTMEEWEAAMSGVPDLGDPTLNSIQEG